MHAPPATKVGSLADRFLPLRILVVEDEGLIAEMAKGIP
jgi:hypothetical protein